MRIKIDEERSKKYDEKMNEILNKKKRWKKNNKSKN
jgi:hypothetical protein